MCCIILRISGALCLEVNGLCERDLFVQMHACKVNKLMCSYLESCTLFFVLILAWLECIDWKLKLIWDFGVLIAFDIDNLIWNDVVTVNLAWTTCIWMHSMTLFIKFLQLLYHFSWIVSVRSQFIKTAIPKSDHRT